MIDIIKFLNITELTYENMVEGLLEMDLQVRLHRGECNIHETVGHSRIACGHGDTAEEALKNAIIILMGKIQ